jgi:pilus assembly protein CpaE
VIVGHNNDVTLYRELIRNGVSEYIVAPVSIADLMNVDLHDLFVDPDAEPLGRSVALSAPRAASAPRRLLTIVSWAISTLFQ